MSLCSAGDLEDMATDWDHVAESFEDMEFRESLLKGIYKYGFEKPSAIQQRGIVPFVKGYDVIEQAQSRIARTATFCAGILQQLDLSLLEC